MDVDSNVQTKQWITPAGTAPTASNFSNVTTKACVTDPSITKLSETFLLNLHLDQQKLQDAGEDISEATKYNATTSNAVERLTRTLDLTWFDTKTGILLP